MIGGVFYLQVEMIDIRREGKGVTPQRTNCLNIVLCECMRVMSEMLSADPELIGD